MQQTDTLLIYLGKNPVSWAAVSISQAMGCKAFVVVSTEREKECLKETFPKLKEDYIGRKIKNV